MIDGSHLVSPPIRDEEFRIEWRCLDCKRSGTASVPRHLHAREVFRRMEEYHNLRANKPVMTCPRPTFKWARIK